MSFEQKGKIHKIFDTESKTDTFQTRDLILTTEGQYPQYIKFQFTQDRCAVLDSYKADEEVNVFFDLRGREWNDKYFTNLNAWKIEKVSSQPTSVDEFPPIESMPSSESQNQAEDFDDLPF